MGGHHFQKPFWSVRQFSLAMTLLCAVDLFKGHCVFFVKSLLILVGLSSKQKLCFTICHQTEHSSTQMILHCALSFLSFFTIIYFTHISTKPTSKSIHPNVYHWYDKYIKMVDSVNKTCSEWFSSWVQISCINSLHFFLS